MVTDSPGVSGPASGAEAARDLQDRIARFSRLLFVVSATLIAPSHLPDLARLHTVTYAPVPHLLGFLALFVVWRRCRGSVMSMGSLQALDAGVTSLTCCAWATFGYFRGGIPFPVGLGMILALTHTLISRSVLVPSTFRRTLWISTLSAAPVAAVIVLRGPTLLPEASPERVRTFVVFSVLWCAAAVAAAALNSKTIYGLRKQLLEAGKLGQYTLEEKIGEGGMGVVYRATHSMLRRPAAIKLLLKDRASETDLARFEREVQLTSRLAHPNTISIFDYGRTVEGVFYYVMEYLDGLDLQRLVEQYGPQPPARAIHILTQIAGALSEAHALGLIHRDIKPANVVLSERPDEPDVVKVVDFGLVKKFGPTTGESTDNHAIVGTPLYMAPETISNPDSIDGRSDLYALGAVAYFLLTGQHVFEAASMLEVCSKHLLSTPVSPSVRLGKPLPADLEAIVLACLAKDREARPASAVILRAALLACADAPHYDVPAARAWWQAWRASMAGTATGVRLARADGSRPATMAIDLGGRNTEAVTAVR